MPLRVAIIGRPNVGKSTLFNRLAGRRLALVDDQPGVTRDRREHEVRLGDLDLILIDTAGLEDAADGSLQARMRAGTEAAIERADSYLRSTSEDEPDKAPPQSMTRSDNSITQVPSTAPSQKMTMELFQGKILRIERAPQNAAPTVIVDNNQLIGDNNGIVINIVYPPS